MEISAHCYVYYNYTKDSCSAGSVASLLEKHKLIRYLSHSNSLTSKPQCHLHGHVTLIGIWQITYYYVMHIYTQLTRACM